MATVKENLIAARALIDTPEKWLSDGAFYRDGKYCAIGAIEMSNGTFTHFREMKTECEAIFNSLPEKYKTGMTMCMGDIFIYNDDIANHSEIMGLFDRAIEAAE